MQPERFCLAKQALILDRQVKIERWEAFVELDLDIILCDLPQIYKLLLRQRKGEQPFKRRIQDVPHRGQHAGGKAHPRLVRRRIGDTLPAGKLARQRQKIYQLRFKAAAAAACDKVGHIASHRQKPQFVQRFDKRTGAFATPNVYSILDNEWHTYGMLWTKDCINMYVDGILYQSYDLNKDFSDDGKGMEGFKTEALCISFNNHLFTPAYNKSQTNGWVINKVLDENFTESIYDIDYVRLYQDENCILNKAD